jgi:hypothetical protein
MHRLSSPFSLGLAAACAIAAAGCSRGVDALTVQTPKQKAEAANGEVLMSKEQAWNDEARGEFRARLRSVILGEIRLAKLDHESILERCREAYIDEECPESERGTFIRIASDELNRAVALLATEQAVWPEVTDCDRLDRVEAALREKGILLWQVSPCCDTCTVAELPDRIEVINKRYPGFRDRARGYAFFIDQNMPEMLADSTQVSVYLAYGWFSQNDSEVAPDVYEANALGIAREVCGCLRDEGFEPNWDADFARKVGVSINWQRRMILQ